MMINYNVNDNDYNGNNYEIGNNSGHVNGKNN